MKQYVVGVIFVTFALQAIDRIARNPFIPMQLVDNELVATAYIHTTDTHVNFMVHDKKITAKFREKKPLQLYTS